MPAWLNRTLPTNLQMVNKTATTQSSNKRNPIPSTTGKVVYQLVLGELYQKLKSVSE